MDGVGVIEVYALLAEVVIFIGLCAWLLVRAGKSDRQAQDAVYEAGLQVVALKQDLKLARATSDYLDSQWKRSDGALAAYDAQLNVLRARLANALDDKERIAYDRDELRGVLAYMTYQRDMFRHRYFEATQGKAVSGPPPSTAHVDAVRREVFDEFEPEAKTDLQILPPVTDGVPVHVHDYDDGRDPHLAAAAKNLGITYDEASQRYGRGDAVVREARAIAKTRHFATPRGAYDKPLDLWEAKLCLEIAQLFKATE